MARFKVKGFPWSSGLGKNVSNCVTSREVMKEAGLNWSVNKCNLVAQMPITIGANNTVTKIDELNGAFAREGHIYRNLPEAYATYRTDRNIPLGLVKSKYEVVQNTDAFNFFDRAIGEDKCRWDTAGCFGYGHKIFVTAKIDFVSKLNIGGHEDPIENYLVFSNSHDGSSSITIMFTPIRVFCTNCLNAGLNKAETYIRLRHTQSVKDKLEEGAEILKIAFEKANNAKQLYEALYTIKMSDDQVLEYLANLALTDAEREALLSYDKEKGYKRLINKDYMTLERTGVSVRKANTIESMFEYYNTGVAQENILGTAWGAYNAVTGYYSNVANLAGEKRMESLLYGNAQNIMQNSIISAYNLAKAM